jgi:hypothetical protein
MKARRGAEPEPARLLNVNRSVSTPVSMLPVAVASPVRVESRMGVARSHWPALGWSSLPWGGWGPATSTEYAPVVTGSVWSEETSR